MTRQLRTTTMTTRRAIRLTALAALSIACAAAWLLNASSANAGSWVQVSCVNPNQTAAPSQGWSSFTSGSIGSGSNNDTACAPGDPMLAELSTNVAEPVNAGENLQYTPPAGSALAGGSISVGMYGDGYGADASGVAIAYTPNSSTAAQTSSCNAAPGNPLARRAAPPPTTTPARSLCPPTAANSTSAPDAADARPSL